MNNNNKSTKLESSPVVTCLCGKEKSLYQTVYTVNNDSEQGYCSKECAKKYNDTDKYTVIKAELANDFSYGKCFIELGDLFIPKKYCFDENHEWIEPKDYPKDKLGVPEVFTAVEYEGGYGIVDLTEGALLDSVDYRSDNGNYMGGYYSTESELQTDCDLAFGNDNYVIIKKYAIDNYMPKILKELRLQRQVEYF